MADVLVGLRIIYLLASYSNNELKRLTNAKAVLL